MIDVSVFIDMFLPKKSSRHRLVIRDDSCVTIDDTLIGRVGGTASSGYFLFIYTNHTFLWGVIKERLDKDEIMSLFNPTCYEWCAGPEFETVNQLEEFLTYIADVLYDVLKEYGHI